MSANAVNEINANAHLRTWYKGLGEKTLCELEQARAASAKYRDFNKAIADGYADINVVVQNMGYHFMRSKQVDATFEISKPELLVYNKLKDGSFQLVLRVRLMYGNTTPILICGFSMHGFGNTILTEFLILPILQ
jgi:hypothetical protein